MTAPGPFDLRDNVAFVTGAASGLGRAIAEVLAANGAHVVLADVDAAALEEGVTALQAAGFSAEGVAIDLAAPADLRAIIAGVAERHGRLDSVFANAGISGGPGVFTAAGALVNVDLAAFDRVLQINVAGTFATVQAAAAAMIPFARGRIVITTSAAALKAEPMLPYSYSLSKAALVHLVRHAAVELAQHGILVSGIAPGPFKTNLGGGAMLRNPALIPKLTANIPLARLGEPEEIKGIALCLASGAASYMTGNIIAIDGGSSAC